MYVVDTNVLIYAVNTAATHHAAARGWLTGALNSGETVGFTWVSLLGFVRLTTNPSIMPRPLDVSAAMAVVEAWTVPANAVVAEPGPRHLAILAELLTRAGAGGNVTTDAHIGAIALENRCAVATFDHGFARYGVEVVVPTAAAFSQ